MRLLLSITLLLWIIDHRSGFLKSRNLSDHELREGNFI